jgi:putative transposase
MRVNSLAPKYKLRLPAKLFIVDSTVLELSLTLFPWAKFRKAKGAIKLHTSLDADGMLPSFVHMTDGKVHDSKLTHKFQFPKGSYIVFDRAYHDFNQYKSFRDNQIRFVTRMKTNAAYQVIESRKKEKYSCVISDETIVFTGYQTHKKHPHPLRRIQFWDKENQKILVFLTNDFQLTAKTIADIYKARWEIELFFKTIKQNLKIKNFLGTSRNAVLTQIWIAMIVYLLLSYFKFQIKSTYSIRTLINMIRVNLFESKSINSLFKFGREKPHQSGEILQQSLFSV